jgi:hypothetical protein
MGPARAGKHGGRCVGPIPGSPRSHLNGTRLTSFPGCLRAASHEKVARNRLQLRTPGVGNLRSRSFQSVCTGCNLCRAYATYVNVGCVGGRPGLRPWRTGSAVEGDGVCGKGIGSRQRSVRQATGYIGYYILTCGSFGTHHLGGSASGVQRRPTLGELPPDASMGAGQKRVAQ